ncbi:MAG: nitroreductase family protein [Fibrobacteraceae bacterium]
MEKKFLEAVRDRRSIYALGKEKVITRQRIQEIVEDAVMHVPSAFNSQSARVVLLNEKESSKFWNMTRATLKKIVPEDAFITTNQKMDSFDAGFGTILFFEDQAVVNEFVTKFPTYKDKFPMWSLQSSGMLQFTIWTAFEAEGLGASLQHYNPLIDAEVKEEWCLPESWVLLAEMPFGSVVAPAGAKEFSPIRERVKVFG